ncbi:MAG TPA: TIGR00730 family Rossman fold protein [Alphaproteobacteria bacterium]|nr:TIGR00730 family Rossman fold protein [Alphaproteobacteria bacterium]
MARVTSLCVYCGASAGSDPRHADAATELGKWLGESGITLVYGGGRVGLMGIVADAALAAGGKVIGVIPTMLKTREIAHSGCEMIAVDTMHARKQKMFELADAFAILPGGLGTLDEAFEMITWKQLRMHDKPILLLDIAGYWRPFREMMRHVVEGGFARGEHETLITPVETIAAIPAALAALPEPAIPAQPDKL